MHVCALISHASPVRVWGLTPTERISRFLDRRGIPTVTGLAEADGASSILLVRGDHVYDDRLLSALIENPDTAMRAGDAADAAVVAAHLPAARAGDGLDGLSGVAPGELVTSTRLALLKSEEPFALLVTDANRRAVERRLYDSSYKGVTDLVTKWVWPTPARWVVGGCVRLGISPNQVTGLGFTLMVVALVLFTRGAYAWGLLAAWTMTFLDTVDGKLARTTLTSSRFGHWLDKLTDIVHPPFWYLAWAHGLNGEFDSPTPAIHLGATVWTIFAFYLGGRIAEGLASGIITGGLFVWRPVDSFLRLITARRNTCLLLLTACAIGHRPDLGLWLVATWTAATTVLLVIRLLIAWAAWRPSKRKLTSWLLDVDAHTPGTTLAARWFAQRPRTNA